MMGPRFKENVFLAESLAMLFTQLTRKTAKEIDKAWRDK